VQEHQQLSTELATLEAQALQTETVQEKQESARQIQIKKMQEVEPELMQIVRQRSKLIERIQGLQGQQQSPRAAPGTDS